MSADETFAGWCILEIMGHRRLGGWVTETVIAGAGFLRIDIPNDESVTVSATQYYPPSSLYAMTPCSESAARAVARANKPEPVQRWELPQLVSDLVRVAEEEIWAEKDYE